MRTVYPAATTENARVYALASCVAQMLFLVSLVILLVSPSNAQGQGAAPSQLRHDSQDRLKYLKAPLSFEPNVGQQSGGQTVPGALFLSHGANYSLELTPARAQMTFVDESKVDASTAPSGSKQPSVVTLDFLGADPTAEVSGKTMLPGKHNYLPSSDPKTWHSNVPTYREVQYQHLYRGVDVSFYGNPDHLEYDFQVAPAADPSQIRLSLAGAESISADEAGNLVLVSAGRTVRFLKPVAYQSLPGGERKPVDAAYRIAKVNNSSQPVITIALGNYDPSQPLTIDPVIDYAFYLPATVNGYLYVGASTTDASGNTYISGTFPLTGGSSSYQGGFFVAKYNSSGEEIFDTTLGTSKFPNFEGVVSGIAVDSTGKIYMVGDVTGAYGGALPNTANAYQTSAASAYNNGFLSVLSADGSTLTYSTYFGACCSGSVLQQVAVDSSGNAYVGGITYTASLPITPGAAVPTYPTAGPGFVAKFDPNLSGTASLIYSTFLGGTAGGAAAVFGIAVDTAGDAYVTGYTSGIVYPTTPGAYKYNGRDPLNDVFVTKVNPTGTAFIYSALLGPGKGDGIAIDSTGNAYVAGIVSEDDYPTTGGAYQTTYPSGFVTELNPQGSALVYSTFLGGPQDSLGSGPSYISPTHIALPPGCASSCETYVTGFTNGSDFPLIDQVQSYIPGSTWSGFYLELAGNGSSALQSSYIASGAGFDPYQNVPGIGVDSTGNIYLAGDALPLDFPVTQTTAGPTGEGFLVKIAPPSGAKLSVSPSHITFPTQIVGVSTTQEGLVPETVYLENLGTEAATISSITASPASVFSQTNDCGGTVAAGGNCEVTLYFTPSVASTVASPQNGSIAVASSASVNPTLQLSGTGINDRYIVASCGSVTPCPGLVFPETLVGSSTAQTVTLTNVGNTAVAFSAIASNLPDFGILTDCPESGTGLAKGQSCQVSATFRPTQVGLRAGTVSITSPGTTSNAITLTATGTGLLSPNPSSLVLLDSILNFGTETVGATSTVRTLTVFNNGSAPATIFSPTASTAGDATGVSDYAIASNSCGQVLPQASCAIGVTFTPTAAGTRSGTMRVATSASSTALTSSLTGIGVAGQQTLEFSPDAITFNDQPIDASSAAASVYVYNVGPSPVSIDRVVVSGPYQITATNCPQMTLQPKGLTNQDQNCSVTVVFSPTATGMQSGTVTVIDTEGRQSAFSLAGNGLAQNGSILVSPAGLNFQPLPVGTQSGPEYVTFTNVGNSPVTVVSVTPTGDFLFTGLSSGGCPAAPYVLGAGQACSSWAYFLPTQAANPDNGTLNVSTSAGNSSVSLTGVGLQASKTLVLTPAGTTGVSFGTIQVGVTANSYPYSYAVNVYNTGTDPVTFSAAPAISGANAADFAVAQNNCPAAGNELGANASCDVYLQFTPSASGTRSGVLTLLDNASTGSGTQTIAITGTGASALPSYKLLPETLVFAPQAVTTTSGGLEVVFTNNTAAPVTIASVVFQPAGNFVRVQNYYGDCNEGAVGPSGKSCSIEVEFTPQTSGPITSTMTLTDASGNVYTTQLYGYGTTPTVAVFVTPAAMDFAPQPQLSTSVAQNIALTNDGDTVESVGQATGTNVILGSSTTGAFKVTLDGCSNLSFRFDYPNNACNIAVTLSPTSATALGVQTGSVTIPITFPVTPTQTRTVNYTVQLSGTVVAPINSAELSPTVLTFPDEAVIFTPTNGGDAVQYIYLNNKSNLPFAVGAPTSTNTGASGPFTLYAGNCSNTSVAAGSSCTEEVGFAPTTAASGVTGTLSYPITFTNGKTTTLTATYSGNALAAKNSILISPSSASFGTEVVGETGNLITFNVTNNGNQPIALGTYTLTSTQPGANFTRSGFDYNSCSADTLPVGSSCSFNIYFTPQTTGTINGTLTIADGSATAGPHAIPLTGVGLAASQAIAVSQHTVGFGSQTVGTSSSPQAVYFSNQSSSYVTGFTYTLGGANASDFTLKANTCGATIFGYQTCALLVSFAPGTTSLGARSATVTATFTGSGSPITVTLNGTGVPPAPAVSLFPASLSYAPQNVGSTSASQTFSVYNTGSASLTITGVASTDIAEFVTSSDACTGKTLAPGQYCLVSVAFSPAAAGARSGSIQITDNAGNSPQAVAVNGTGVVAPVAVVAPTSFAFANTNVGSTAAYRMFTITNTGNATLTVSSITSTGANASSFTIPGNRQLCGSVAAGSSCTFDVAFTPTTSGALTASIHIADNAGSSPQSVTVSGTGISAPAASISPASFTFADTNVGSTAAYKVFTLTNTGGESLTVSSIASTGTDASSFSIPSNHQLCTTVAAGASCTFDVAFTPATPGALTASIQVADNAAGSPQSVTVSGTGVGSSAPAVSISPASFSFANTNVGSTAAYKMFTLTNTGNASLTISSIASTGTDASSFTIPGNHQLCSTVAAGASCTFDVAFTPTVTGGLTASIQIADNAAGSPQSVTVSGTGE